MFYIHQWQKSVLFIANAINKLRVPLSNDSSQKRHSNQKEKGIKTQSSEAKSEAKLACWFVL